MTLKQKIIDELKQLHEHEIIKVCDSNEERLIFKNRDKTFKIFSDCDDESSLNPFKDYTYDWLDTFLCNVCDFLEYDLNDEATAEEIIESLEKFGDDLHEQIDSTVSIYTSDLIKWLGSHNSNVYYLEDAIKEFPDGDNHLQLAQYKAIEESFNSFLNSLKKYLEEILNED